jgi:ribonuclease-3
LENDNEHTPVDALEQTLGVRFADRDLLTLALVHSSYLNENPEDFPESNERLEFLGDALIGLVVAHRLYGDYPSVPEGGLTAMRSSLVRGDTLADVARSLNLGSYLLLGTGEDAGGGREKSSNLAAAFEAVVGALLLDRGYRTARTFVLRALSDQLEALARDAVVTNPKSMLQELVQGRHLDAPTYRIVDETGREHARRFTAEVIVGGRVLGRGTGGRKASAEQEAAREALEALDQDI